MTHPPAQPEAPLLDDAWGLGEPEPTSVIVPWPGADAPAPEAVAAAMSAGSDGSITLHEILPPADAAMPWCAVFARRGRAAPLVSWVEPARPLAGDEPPEVAAAAARWVVGFETLLDPADAIGDFSEFVGRVAAAVPAVPGVLDVNTTRWYGRADLDRLFGDGPETPAEVMWLTQVVRGTADRTADTVWIHTHGMWRCGRPELEMLEVPADAAAGAAELLGGVASLILERGAPPPGLPLEVGSDLFVVLQPWAEVARYLEDDTPGSPAGRTGEAEAAHAGPRAVVCAPELAGTFRKLWVWPSDAVARLSRNEAAMSLTERATRRQAHAARAEWDQLVSAFAAAASPAEAEFAVKAGLVTDPVGGDDRREHLWFDVERADAAGLDGRLLNEPRFVRGLAAGATVRLGREQISDWRVMTPERSFGPFDVDALRRRLGGDGASA